MILSKKSIREGIALRDIGFGERKRVKAMENKASQSGVFATTSTYLVSLIFFILSIEGSKM